MLLIIGGPGAIPATGEETARLFPAVYLATVAGPALAGILLTVLAGGWTGLRDLLSQLLKWRVGTRWYAAALLTTPISVLATLLTLSLVSPEFVPGILTTGVKASLLRFGFMAGLGLVTGFLEELGWTGFAVPTLLGMRYGVLGTGLIVGFLWGAWHFLSNVWASGASSGVPLALFMPAILFSFLLPYRVLMVWVYDRAGSLLVAILMHASLVAFWLTSMPHAIAGVPLVTWYLVWAAALWVVVAAVAMANGGHLSRQQLRRRMA
ncbi:MAG: CPBP family intramembrane metalloprotease [Actinomycetota bacterium]|nr:CPBP family intramembrane metalloprotease [Actinomycetota bacterium]